MESSSVNAENSHSWYSISSLKAKIRLENSFKVIVLLDIGAKINVMTRKIIEDAGLAIQHGLKLELISRTNHSRLFGLLEDVEVGIRGLKTKHPIFVIKHGDHDLVLGQPFLNLVKFSQEYKPDGIFGTITHFQTQQLGVFQTLALQNPAN